MRLTRPLVLLAAAALSVALSAVASADVVTLRNGTTVEGRLRRAEGGWTILAPDGRSIFIEAAEVASVRLTDSQPEAKPESKPDKPAPGPPDEAVAKSRLQSLRRAVANVADPAEIVRRYKRFIEQVKATPAAQAEASADLAVWQDRIDRQMVRMGDDWLTPDQRRQRAVNALQAALRARDFLKQDRPKEAADVLAAALKVDPENVSALYLQGLLLLDAGQLPQARATLEKVDALAPRHAPTLYDLGVINLRQNQQMRAAKYFSDALAAAPINRQLLDGVAEVLDALPPEDRPKPPAKTLAAEFARQDAILAGQLAAQGLYRWGSSYVPAEKKKEIDAAQEKVDARLKELQGDFDLTQAAIERTDADLAATQSAMRRMEADTIISDADGHVFRRPLPPAYYDLQRDVLRLQREKQDSAARIDALRAAAKKARSEQPYPPFTGKIDPVREDGLPVLLPPGVDVGEAVKPAATQPATPPATQTATTRAATP